MSLAELGRLPSEEVKVLEREREQAQSQAQAEAAAAPPADGQPSPGDSPALPAAPELTEERHYQSVTVIAELAHDYLGAKQVPAKKLAAVAFCTYPAAKKYGTGDLERIPYGPELMLALGLLLFAKELGAFDRAAPPAEEKPAPRETQASAQATPPAT